MRNVKNNTLEVTVVFRDEALMPAKIDCREYGTQDSVFVIKGYKEGREFTVCYPIDIVYCVDGIEILK